MWIRNRRAISAEYSRRNAYPLTHKSADYLSTRRKQYSPHSKVGNAIHSHGFARVTPIDLIGFSRHTLSLHNSPHTLTLVRIKARGRIPPHSSLQSLSCAIPALQFKFHSNRFVTDRHRLPNSDKWIMTNGIRICEWPFVPVNDHWIYILIRSKKNEGNMRYIFKVRNYSFWIYNFKLK